MRLLNTFNATVWTTPLVIGFVMSQCLRRKLRPIARAALWVIYLAWAWGWVSIWYSINSGGSGRFAVEQLIFDYSVWVTTLLGAGALGWAELARLDERRLPNKHFRCPPAWHPLQPLRIPAGWTVAYNNGLYEIDPPGESVPEDERWVVFKEDMLQLRNEQRNRLLDLGWYPEGNMTSGQYGLVVYEGDFHGRLLHEFRGRDRAALVDEIERLLAAISEGEL